MRNTDNTGQAASAETAEIHSIAQIVNLLECTIVPENNSVS